MRVLVGVMQGKKIREQVKEMGCDILGLHCSYDGVALMIFVYGMTLES